jgi:UDP-glucose 4-epimerase
LLALAIDATLGLSPPLRVLGDDYQTPDGSCIRDFVHVSGLADAHVRALQWLIGRGAGGVHEAFNLGSGSGCSVKEVVWEVARVINRPVPHKVGPRRPGDSPTSSRRYRQGRTHARLEAGTRSCDACFAGRH